VIDPELIRSHLRRAGHLEHPGALGSEIRALSSVSSTNDIAWAWADAGCPEGTVILAEEQILGRGRFGRAWACPRGQGLLMSVVFRPPDGRIGPAHLTALAALAVAEAAEALAPLSAAIRWPNDVTIGTRKLAGVLVEARGECPSPCVLGVGLNVNTRADEFPGDLRTAATSLVAEVGEEFGIEAVAAAVLGRLDLRYRDALEGRWAGVVAEWRRRSTLQGAELDVESRGEAWRGRVVGLDPLEGIVLELSGGERRTFRAEWTTLVKNE